MLPALCKGVEKICMPRKIDTAFKKKKNLVEKILDYTLSFILPSFYNVLNRQRGLSAHKRSPVECLVKTRRDLKLQTPYNSSLSQRSVYLSFSERSTEITSTKIFWTGSLNLDFPGSFWNEYTTYTEKYCVH